MPDPAAPKIRAHPHKLRDRTAPSRTRHSVGGYAELAVTSNFTFLTGASHPDEFVIRAAELGYRAIAITDTNSLAGVVRAHVAAQETDVQLVVGCRLVLQDVPSFSLFVYPTDRAAYGRLCRLLTLGKRRATKGECHLTLRDALEWQTGMLGIALVDGNITPAHEAALLRLRETFDDDRLSLGLTRLYGPKDREQWSRALALSERCRIPPIALNDAHYHAPRRRALQDVLTCVRHGCRIDQAGMRLYANGERYLKAPAEMARLFAERPDAIERTLRIAERTAGFSLRQLRYEYPHEVCPRGRDAMRHLRELTAETARDRYPDGVPEKVQRQLEHEFALIEELEYAPYFLTVHDLVRFARGRGILCQGRGAAANSAVCFCLGVTSVDPDRIDVLFERFVSRERQEPPDIDIDFEHERREEVIQYIYRKYGRERAGLTAEVITYRGRSAVRDVGKALGLSLDAVDQLAKRINHWTRDVFETQDDAPPQELRELGFDPADPTIRNLISLTRQIVGFPRHLSQHVGGFVITRGALCELTPIENAAMPERTVIEWDKDDIDALGILKIDVLGLGMLTCLRKGFELVERHHDWQPTLANIPAEDPAVYDMICEADTLGVFQIESRAQMTMLPRLRPRCFYDLVIEVAIVRPGPIVGDMVHPYLRRRNGEEDPNYPDEKIKAVLGKTLGIPLFQEQAMSLAVVAAGFTAGEAEMLRRAVTAWKSEETIARYAQRFVNGMIQNGYDRAFAEQCFGRLKGFSEYGFPESHAASFALLVYASAWLKRHYSAAFAAALLNSQPMGFYAPAQIVRDAADHGVEIRQIDVNHSQWDCTLEGERQALRLGLRMVSGLRERDAQAVVAAVQTAGPFSSILSLWRGSRVHASSLRTLALADAFGSMGLDRQHALWEAQALRDRPLPLFDELGSDVAVAPLVNPREPEVELCLPPISALSEVSRDYGMTGLSLKAHPMSFLRQQLREKRILTAEEIKDETQTPHGRRAAVAGLVLFRQRPSTAGGVMFMTIEDETTRADLILRPRIHERYRSAALYGRVVIARGRVERQGRVVHVLVSHIADIGEMLAQTPMRSRDFR